MPTFVEVSKQPIAAEFELVVGRTLLRVRGLVETGAMTPVLDVLEAPAPGSFQHSLVHGNSRSRASSNSIAYKHNAAV